MSEFDPTQYLTAIRKGGEKNYLEVKWRVAWFRAEHPEGIMRTELHTLGDRFALFHAEVGTGNGGSASGWGSETQSDFTDFIEKAETKALGRALAALGYGSQFCEDWGGDSVDNPVDAPVQRPAQQRQAASVASIDQSITDKQRKFLFAIAKEKGMTNDELEQASMDRFGVELKALSRRDASQLVEALQAVEPGKGSTGSGTDGTPEDEALAKIYNAKTHADLQSVGRWIAQQETLGTNAVREAYKSRQGELIAAAAGSPGADRFTS